MLKQRIVSGLLLGAALLLSAFVLPPAGVGVVLVILCGMGLLEFYALLDARQIPHFKIVGLLGGLALVGGTWMAERSSLPWKHEAEGMLLAAAFAAILVRQIIYSNHERAWETIAGTLLGVLYVGFFLNFFTKLLVGWGDLEGRYLVLFMILVVKITDIGAYFIGCAIGRHKLIPRISPAKTWEGVIGGVLSGMAASVGLFYLTGGDLGGFTMHLQDALALGPVLAVTGVIGDLIESLLKRASGVKDSGTIIQGMGGLLDVLDSLLFAAPVMYIYTRCFMA